MSEKIEFNSPLSVALIDDFLSPKKHGGRDLFGVAMVVTRKNEVFS